MFLYGMKVMSEGLQKAAGDRLRNILSAMTRNRFTGMLTVDSHHCPHPEFVGIDCYGRKLRERGSDDSCTVNGSHLRCQRRNYIHCMDHSPVRIQSRHLGLHPSSHRMCRPLLFASASRKKSIGEFLIGFALMFMGLDLISDYVPDLQSNPEMFQFLERYASMGFISVLLFVLVGVVLTAIIQSSAATFAIVLIMCTKGWISFDLACAVVLGSNIGTTITPLLASMSGNVAAKRTAMGHLLFNMFGIVWTLAVFYPFVRLNVDITKWLGQGDPNSIFGFVNDLEANDPQLYNSIFDNSLPAGHPVPCQNRTDAVQCIVRPVDVPYDIQPHQCDHHDMAHRLLCESG